ncbi:MAG: thiamine phosphate synthase [Burkholderiales bacterium]
MSAAATERAARRARIAGVYAVTPDATDTVRLTAQVAAAIAGGARVVQYRNKTASSALRAGQAAALAHVCAAHGALLIVNDDADLAIAVQADGVHLGEDDGDLAATRARVGDAMLIGVSCYDDAQRARDLAAAGADYVAFGSFFLSQVKPGARRADVSLLAGARTLGVPVVAIGGITADNARSLVVAGADAVAVISAIFAPGEPAAITTATRALAACFP